ncbi:MAG: transketolase [Atopobiaceae bacterium]|nr:transketolase [Atopobiaceae bacterium]MCH4181498.1 transketolase [Atopobiaceae bacterium]MCH4215158.1 transketolase [Atopobiaceae bacterium]MCH4230570.1 transketolase [Atopobiaceae bacterium]MCH4275896.1 transketolase [Atopobiaceae bacterium]
MNTTQPPCSPGQIRLIANAMRHDVITELEASKSGHPGGSLSAADIVATLFFSGLMKYDPKQPDDHSQDHFILSKGHAAPVLYAAFHQLGWLTDDDMLTLRQLGSKLQGHPDAHACPGVEVCSGSLGQGLSVSTGIALGLKMDAKRDGTDPHHVFCVLGDGEMQEGSNWEALMFAASRGLDNIVAFLDLNNLQIDGHVTDVCTLGDVDAKLTAFGWSVQHIDGHDVDAIEAATSAALAHTGNPSIVVCDTIKGKGVSFMEDQQGWHGVAPDHDQAAAAIAELDAQLEELEKEVDNG